MIPFISLHQVVPYFNQSLYPIPVDWQINKGEIWSVLGNNGSGKSTLADIIRGKTRLKKGDIHYHYFEEIKRGNPSEFLWPGKYIHLVGFETVNSISNFKGTYYQQRFNSQDADLSPKVSEVLNPDNVKISENLKLLKIDYLLNNKLIELSSGEQRKLVIAKILSEDPRMLIFDNPFFGLDKESRENLNEIFSILNKEGIQLIFLIPSASTMPACTTHVLKITGNNIQQKKNSEKITFFATEFSKKRKTKNESTIFKNVANSPFSDVVKMDDIRISYGERIINSSINWHIKKGEKWALLGPNGSGKSTLLSYIFADNPQAYAKKLALFDRRRGTGESIWDIKKHIGFISSEMHLYYRKDISCLEVVESGFFDSIGIYRSCDSEQEKMAKNLVDELSINHLINRSFLKVSSGEQRLVLLARALVKNPELLILDEPFNGLDDKNKNRCSIVIDLYCSQPDKTLIFVTHFRNEIPDCINLFMELKKINNPIITG